METPKEERIAAKNAKIRAQMAKIQAKLANRHQKCVKCGEKKLFTDFGLNSGSSTGYQTYCKKCKNALGDRRRLANISARIRHHFATRIKLQLGKSCPENYVKELHLLLGYGFSTLKVALNEEIQAREGISLRKALSLDYHIDHIRPLSSFKVIRSDGTVDWDTFRECWAISNLRAIAAEANLKKGARRE